MENSLRKNRLDKLLGRKRPKGIYSYSKKKGCRRKGKDHTLALMRYWKWPRMIFRKTASPMLDSLLSQVILSDIFRSMVKNTKLYPVRVGVDKGSEEGDRTVIQPVIIGGCLSARDVVHGFHNRFQGVSLPLGVLDSPVVESFKVEMGHCELGVSPLISCSPLLKQEEILKDGLQDFAKMHPLPELTKEELITGLHFDFVKKENRVPSVEVIK